VKKMMIAALDRLAPTDTVAVVTYANQAKVVLPPTFVAKRSALDSAIGGLEASGSTAGADGLGLAYQQAAVGYVPEGINHIVLCTDGDFNVGPSSTSALLAIIKEKRATGVTLTALGFGRGNLNDAMMEQISNAGNGIYSVIIDEASARKYVDEKLLSTILHVAKDLKLQVEFNPEQVLAYRLLGYENRSLADQDFRNDTVDAGEVGAGHRVTALYELVLAGGTVPQSAKAPVPDDGLASTLPREVAPADLVLVKVRYKAIGAANSDPAIETAASLPFAQLTDQWSLADQDLQWAVAVAALAELLKGSPYADRGFLPVLRGIVAAQATRDADRQEFATLLETILPRL
jgi:Ca-activated chloride channel family protein